MARKKAKTGRRYSPADKKKILRTAKQEGLSGKEVQKRFGVAALTFYRWRGPVNSKKTRRKKTTGFNDSILRQEIRSRIETVLPQIIHEEVDSYLANILGKKTRGGRR